MRLAWCLVAACSYTPSPGLVVDDANPIDGDAVTDAPPVAGTHVRPIQIAGTVTGGPHVGFPIMLAISGSFLRTTASGGQVESTSGHDIAFSADPDGIVPLAHEVERYLGDTGELIAWVKLPSLAQDTTFYLHYGNPAITSSQEDIPGVWTSGYAAVWHLTGFVDATALNPGTNGGTNTMAGQVVDARRFDGGTNTINVASDPSLDNMFDGGGTAEAWYFATGSGGSSLGRVFDKARSVLGLCDGNSGGANAVLFGHAFTGQAGNWCTAQDTAPFNTWIHVAVVYNNASTANVPVFFINGVEQAVAQAASPNGTRSSDVGQGLVIGNRDDLQRGFDGGVDELRLSKTIRAGGWITTSHANQRAPSSFVTVGAEL